MTELNVVVEVVGDAKSSETNEGCKKAISIISGVKSFCSRNFLPIGIVLSIIIGIILPQPAVYLSQHIPVVQICIIILYFSTGIRLRVVEAKSAVKSYKEAVVGLSLVLLVGPMIGITLLNLVPYFSSFIGEAPNFQNSTSHNTSESIAIFGPEEFRISLQIYCMGPTSPSAALILVTAANGHRGLAILVSILCTIISVFTVPPMLAWLIPTLQDAHLNVVEILLNTMVRILVPLFVGRLMRFIPRVKKVVEKWNNAVKCIGISSLVAILFVKVSQTSDSGNLGKVSVTNILCAVALGTCFTTLNAFSTYGKLAVAPWFSAKSTVTLSIVSSLRVIGLTANIIELLPDNTGDKGLLVLPMVFVYLATLLMLNGFVYFFKVKENVEEEKLTFQTESKKNQNNANIESIDVNPKINEAAIFTIYSDEMMIKKPGAVNESIKLDKN